LLDFDFIERHNDVMESTPQPPPKNWWQRNWKWFVPTGCLTLITLGVLFVLCIVFFVFSILKSSEAYKTAVARAKNDRQVVAALGTPIQEGMFASGKANVNGPSGEADLAIPISGPKGKAAIYVVATKSGGEWNFSKLTVQVEGGETIDLNESAQSKSATEDASETENEQTGDERVEAITLAREEGDGLQPVKNFKRADNPEHIVVTLTDGNAGTHIKTVWTNLNAGGATDQKLWEKELITNKSNPRADFSLANSKSKLFPTGDYKIDIYLDDELIQTVRYKVQ
jgi:Cytochrome oxidase complex assembly protein 1